MNTKTSSLKLAAGGIAVAALLSLPTSTRAVPVTLNIDSSLSSLKFSGSAFGLAFIPQVPGALSTFYSGTIAADLTGGVLTFSGGSSIAGIVNPNGPFTTAPNPIGIEAGNYGPRAVGAVTGFGTVLVNGVYKNLVFDITTGTATDSLAPVGVGLFLTAGTLDYGVASVPSGTPLTAGTSSLTGKGGTDTSASLVSFDGINLVLPVHINTGLYSNRIEDYAGTIYATVVVPVPEPTSLALLGVGLLGLAGVQFHRSRRSR